METLSSRVRNIFLFLIVLLVIEFAPRIGSLVAFHYQQWLVFIDPEQTFSWEVIHHVVQLLIPLAIMILWPGRSMRDWGFRLGDSRTGWKWVFWFTVIWFGIYFVITIPYIIQHIVPKVYYDVTNPRNLLGELSFRAFIVGISEETLFRAFPITILIVFLNRRYKIFHFSISQAGIIAAILFAYAHIGYQIQPLEITHLNIPQLFTAAVMGLLYAIVFEETKSILYPILIHSISDVIPVLGIYALSVINR